jgi:GntR family transcriptional regulator
MTLRIEPESHVPVYLQIVEYLRSAIAAEVYRPGEALPSLRVLASDLKVNPNTVQRAFDELYRQGLIKSHRGVGMFVARRAVHSAVAQAEEAAETAFGQTIALAAASGLEADRIRRLFNVAMTAMSNKAKVRP